jgi:hypothetical protein
LIDARPTPMQHTAHLAGQHELRCGSGRGAARSVDVRVDGSIGVGVDRHARGGRGDGAPVGGAAERSLQRERVCGSGGSSLRGANDQLRFTGSLVGPISLICQRTRASDRLSAKLLCGRVRGRQAAHRRVIDAPSSSSDQQGVKLVERSHRRQSGAAQTAPGEVGAAADEAPRRERKRSKLSTDSRPPPYLTLPYLPRVPMWLQLGDFPLFAPLSSWRSPREAVRRAVPRCQQTAARESARLGCSSQAHLGLSPSWMR